MGTRDQDLLRTIFDARKKTLAHLGKGKSVSVTPAQNCYLFGDTGTLSIQVERKIGRNDVKNGKLLPMAQETTKRRGGKRSLTMDLPFETAEALHYALGKELRAARLRRTLISCVDRFIAHLLTRDTKKHAA